MKTLIYIVFALFCCSTLGVAQETLNASDPSLFIVGGDQGSTTATVTLSPITLVDIEPDPNNTIDFNVDREKLEAGVPVFSHPVHGYGVVTDESLWINYTYRGYPGELANIHVRSNMPVPEGIKITIHINQAGAGGDYKRNAQFHTVTLSEADQVLVRDFPSGYTADGEFNGLQLRYNKENHRGYSIPPGFEVIYELRPIAN